jgi:tetratricopeptide (TPR) repeat protein
MLKSDVVRLVKTLSSTEKRYFKLYCKKQSGDRAYLALFDIIDQTDFKDISQLQNRLQKLHPDASFETTANYLLKTLTNSLVYSKCEKDSLFQQMQSFMRARILFERALVSEAFKELNKVQKLASSAQNYVMEYMCYREELDMFASLNFPDMNESKLVDLQTKGKSTLKSLLQVHEHHSLFEILKTRLTSLGMSVSEEAKRTFNDLLLSELSLVTSKVAFNFQSTKLHLMFQSFFFTSVGDYRSALKTFSELDALFQNNIKNTGALHLDYLSSLEGILDSLRTIRAYDKMPEYISKVKALIHDNHTEQFNLRAAKSVMIFQLTGLIAENRFAAALSLSTSPENQPIKDSIISDYEKHCELLFYCGLAHFGLKQWDKALKYINKITLLGKANFNSAIYKAAKLLGIIIRYELGDIEYIQYEIRAYKRISQLKAEVMKIEKLIFKIAILDPNKNSLVKNKLILKKLQPIITHIQNDKYELQITKYFDFLSWIETKFRSHPTKLSRKEIAKS